MARNQQKSMLFPPPPPPHPRDGGTKIAIPLVLHPSPSTKKMWQQMRNKNRCSKLISLSRFLLNLQNLLLKENFLKDS